jgi:hypothetical protein
MVRVRWAEDAARTANRNEQRILKRNLKKRPPGDLEEMGWEAGDWINLARNRDKWWAVVNTVTNNRVP